MSAADYVRFIPIRPADNICMESLLLIGAATITALILLIGRKRLRIAVPCAFAFLLYAAILIPNLLPPRTVRAQNACMANLQMIHNAKAEWAKRNPTTAESVPRIEHLFLSNNASPYRYIPQCPGGGEYTIGALNQNPTCSLATHGHVLR